MQAALGVPVVGCRRGFLFSAAVFLSLILLPPGVALFGQAVVPGFGQAVVPGGRLSAQQHYDLAMEAYEAGDFSTALDRFQLGARSTRRTTTRSWVDSICFYAMIGECHARMGQYGEALSNYNTALRIHLANPDWLLHARFDPKVRPAAPNGAQAAPWGKTRRLRRFGTVPAMVPVLVPVLVPALIPLTGSLTGELIAVRAGEQIRCLAVCLMGRREVLGPVAHFDPFSREIVDALSLRRVRRGHWSEVWIDLLAGLALEAQGNFAQAKSHLEQAIVMEGVYDHRLTGAVLLALGRLAALEGRPIEAGKFFEEATYAAYVYQDARVLTEAFQRARAVNSQTGGDGYPPLHTAVERFRRTGPQLVYAELLLALVQDQLQSRQMKHARRTLGKLRSRVVRKSKRRSMIGNRLVYLEAALAFEEGNPEEGSRLLAEALQFGRSASKRRYQLHQVDELLSGNVSRLTTRDAQRLYAEVLAEPSPGDWLNNPLDALAWLTDSHEQMFQHWFELAWDRREYEKAFEITERARRHRFLASLPLGGRLLGLRRLLDVPEKSLSDPLQLERQAFLLRFAEYDQAVAKWNKTEASLSRIPFSPGDLPERRRQQALFEEQVDLKHRRESLLHALALLPEPASLVFPPQVPVERFPERLEANQAIWSFYRTERGLFSFFVTRQGVSAWEVARPDEVAEQARRLLEAMGHVEGSRPLSLSTLESNAWKIEAHEMLTMLLGRRGVEILASLEELIVVPDGVLWCVPFEALRTTPHSGPEGIDSLIGGLRIRYAPMASLGVPDAGGEATGRDGTLLVDGRLHPRDSPSRGEQLYRELLAENPATFFLPQHRRSFAAARMGQARRVVVWEELSLEELLGLARGGTMRENGLALAGLPWRGPRKVMIPGLRTPAERSLREVNLEQLSEQMYLTIMHLLAAGPRTLLLSRWRVGGDSTARLMQEFTQELPFTTASDAWQRAVLLSAKRPLDPSSEPRLSLKSGEDAPPPRHPFFWSGYLLVDRGDSPP